MAGLEVIREGNFIPGFETFLYLLFTAIIIAIMVTNPKGIAGILTGLGNFGGNVVGAFFGGRGVVRG